LGAAGKKEILFAENRIFMERNADSQDNRISVSLEYTIAICKIDDIDNIDTTLQCLAYALSKVAWCQYF
jgi:hypothetical protein